MASGISLLLKALNIKKTYVQSVEYVEGSAFMNGEEYPRDHIELHARPYKKIKCRCPVCMKKCSGYDHQSKEEVTWRANSLNGVPVLIKYNPMRIECPEHGVLTEYLPWTDGTSRFTEGFNNEAAFMALCCPKTVVAQYLGINWRTIGKCVRATHGRLEPDVTVRLHGLKRICVDETSYRRGHEYITVVYDLDRNRVVWLHKDHGLEVFKQFCEALTPEEQDAIEVVAGDGARWIDACTNQYFHNARRCVDFFHVVGWLTEALDKAKNRIRSQAVHEVEQMKNEFKAAEKEEKEEIRKTETELDKALKELKSISGKGHPSKRKKELQEYIDQLKERLNNYHEPTVNISEEEYNAAVEELSGMPKRGRRSKRKAELMTIIALYEGRHNDKGQSLSDAHQKIINDLEAKADSLKKSKYALGMNPENLSQSSKDKLKMIEGTHPDVFKAYQLKERLRITLHMKDVKTAEIELDKWITDARNCEIDEFTKLADKIERHRGNILNSVELQVNSSRSEATNTTIKALIATARGFRNLDNMFALIYLRCSDLVVPLHNRYQPSAKKQKELRDLQNERKRQREETKRALAML